MIDRSNPFSLKDKKILITGASSGIGRQIAIDCAEAGAALILNGRNEDRLESVYNELSGSGHTIISGDLVEDESLSKIVENANCVDGVVLCAGIGMTVPTQFATRKKISAVFEVNFFSQVELLRLLIKKKKLNSGASVVAISSIGGNRSYNVGFGPYGATKAALLSWMKTSAKELAPKIRVNCILPGQVNTPLNDCSGITEEQYQAYMQSIPMKRFAEVSDIAPAAVFLLSDASSYITGTELIIDGGTVL